MRSERSDSNQNHKEDAIRENGGWNVNRRNFMTYPIETSLFDYSDIFLPVQVLNQQVVDSALSIEDLRESMDIDVETNDLSNAILFEEEHVRIQNVAEIREIDGKYQITFSLTFGQFMWSVGLYLSTYFDNIVQIPMMNVVGTNVNGYKPNMDVVRFADDTFFRARQLIFRVVPESFTQIPNICDPQVFKKEIGNANGIYVGGMCFIMAHEFAHNFLGHTHYTANQEVTLEDEMNADETALSFISSEFDTGNGFTYKVGIANVLCSLLLMGQDTICSDGAHPHMDVRIDNIMNKLELPYEDILWGYVGCAIRMWLMVYGGYTIEDDMKVDPFDTYGDFYDYYLKLLKEYREKNFPEVVKPDWFIE